MPDWGPRSVSARVTAAAVGVVAIALALVGLVVIAGVRDALVRTVEATADAQARSVVTLAQAGRLPALLEVDSLDRTLLQVVDAEGRVLAASPQLAGLSPLGNEEAALRGGGASSVQVVLPGATPSPFRIVAVDTVGPMGPVTVYAGSFLGDALRAVGVLSWLLLAGGAAALAVVGVVARAVVKRALRPVERMRAEVEAITTDDVGRRVAVPDSHDEVARLAATMNTMLSRLEAAILQQRRLVADVSHEVRNPVSALRTQLEVALAHPDGADWPELARDLLVDTERLGDLADDLLLLARLDAGESQALAASAVDLAGLVREVVGRRPAPRLPVRLELREGVVAEARPAHLSRILDNLLDNAERHADAEVRVRVTVRPGGPAEQKRGSGAPVAVVEVFNDGSPIAPADAERIFERFVRLDAARARDTGGAGLGLPIARQLARAYAGDLRVVGAHGNPPVVGATPGATFELTLPLVQRRLEIGDEPHDDQVR